jgi:hypothetical protein
VMKEATDVVDAGLDENMEPLDIFEDSSPVESDEVFENAKPLKGEVLSRLAFFSGGEASGTIVSDFVEEKPRPKVALDAPEFVRVLEFFAGSLEETDVDMPNVNGTEVVDVAGFPVKLKGCVTFCDVSFCDESLFECPLISALTDLKSRSIFVRCLL